MSDSTRLAGIPSINPAAEPKASNLKAGPNAALNICLRCAPSATRSPSSRSRLLMEYAAIPKIPVIASIAPIPPSTPNHLRFQRPSGAEAWSYNLLQRLTYLFVIFVLFPLVIWTGLAMSPAFVSAVPATVTVLGGQQSARTIHFFVSLSLLLFLLVHVVMVCLAGFRSRMRAMITGRAGTNMERI